MSAALYANLNNSVPAKAPAARGGGQSELNAVATATLPKATTVTNQVATLQASRPAVVTPPATAAGFDRTVATSLGK